MLEGRTLLSGIVVNTINDAIYPPSTGLISLRNAVTTANSSATPTSITFDPTVFATPKTITLNSVLIITNKTALTTITGPAASLTISGQKTFGVSVLEVGNGAKATLNNLTVTNGGAGSSAAGILSLGTVTLNNITATQNASNGINCEAGTATLTNVTSSNNGRAGILSDATMTLTNVTISANKGMGFQNDFANATATNLTVTANQGGGMSNSSLTAGTTLLTITNAIVSNNSSGGDGGGFSNGGNAVLKNVTFSGNSALLGGGIYNHSNKHTLALVNVTLSANKALKNFSNTGQGGGIYNDGTATLTNVTIANNTAGVSGGGIFDASPLTFVLKNTIVAGNSLTGTGGNGPDFSGSVTSFGHNLIGKTDGSSNWIPQDFTGTIASPLNAKLGALANNGGFSPTMLPLAGSPLIDHGLNTLLPTNILTDQRGLTRIVNGIVDIGAVEAQPPTTASIVIKPPANQTAAIGASTLVSLGSFTQNGATGPFKLDINWGDGSADTIVGLPTAGAIPAVQHTFAKAGPLTVSEQITDAKSNKSNKATFTESVSAALGSISGKVFGDSNADGKIDNGEFGVGLWTVYLDLNHNGKLDTGDKSTTTDINGNWSFTGLAAGTYTVRVVPIAGIAATTPAGGVLTVTLSAGQNATGKLFGERATG
ncbi:MAG TPA: choice-of-anchor Q domain-containing protein [Humisphaera sp.]|nr:choice-of-anchor Q domain-containing protein [Humisphaera sp.]